MCLFFQFIEYFYFCDANEMLSNEFGVTVRPIILSVVYARRTVRSRYACYATPPDRSGQRRTFGTLNSGENAIIVAFTELRCTDANHICTSNEFRAATTTSVYVFRATQFHYSGAFHDSYGKIVPEYCLFFFFFSPFHRSQTSI